MKNLPPLTLPRERVKRNRQSYTRARNKNTFKAKRYLERKDTSTPTKEKISNKSLLIRSHIK